MTETQNTSNDFNDSEIEVATPVTVADLMAEVEAEVDEELSKVQRKKLKAMIKEIKGLEALLALRKQQLAEFKTQPLALADSKHVFELEG